MCPLYVYSTANQDEDSNHCVDIEDLTMIIVKGMQRI